MSAVRLAGLFVAAMLLQWWWNSHLSYWGAAPQFLFALTVLIAARRGPIPAMLLGWLWGLYSDVLHADLFGADALLYACAGYAAGLVRRQIDLQATPPLAAAVLILSWIYLIVRGFLGKIFGPAGTGFLWPGWISALATPPMNALFAIVAAEMWDVRRDR
jgi:rod shape-determining protein MreD